ncbi:MAG: DNA alkylation repair protein [Clostridia bacterium]|nr:DNA alkylation repair protein [Clostridia bacterium]
MDKILEEIILKKDDGYKDFHSKLVPNVNNILGLRGPVAKEIAKKYANTDTGYAFLENLPHTYYDENLVHGYMLGFLKCDIDKTKEYIEKFLPYIDNWAVCDSMVCGLKRYFKNIDFVSNFVFDCLKSKKTYTVRFGLVSLLDYYVNDNYVDRIFEETLKIKSDEYYVKMAIAWLYSVCLVKRYEKTLPIIENKLLDKWTHNKAIQKAIESFRITNEQKQYLKNLKIK